MKLPTAEEIAAAKSAAIDKGFSSAAVQLVELVAPIDAAFLVAPFDRAGYAKYVDALHRDTLTAHGGVFASRMLWPVLSDAMKIRDAWPATPSEVVKELERAAGNVNEVVSVARLDVKAPPEWLDEKAAQALADAHRGGVLWTVELRSQELACIMRAPLPDTWLAAVAADNTARALGKGVAASMEGFILETVVAAPVKIEAQLDRRPALFTDLRRAFLKMGGDGVQVRSKRL